LTLTFSVNVMKPFPCHLRKLERLFLARFCTLAKYKHASLFSRSLLNKEKSFETLTAGYPLSTGRRNDVRSRRRRRRRKRTSVVEQGIDGQGSDDDGSNRGGPEEETPRRDPDATGHSGQRTWCQRRTTFILLRHCPVRQIS